MKWDRVNWHKAMFFSFLVLSLLFCLGSIWFSNEKTSQNCVWTFLVFLLCSVISGITWALVEEFY